VDNRDHPRLKRYLTARKLAILALILLSVGCRNKDKPDYSVSGLMTQLKDKNPDTRYSTARGLGKYGVEAKPAVPALTETLKDENAMVRMGVAYALGDIGADAKEAVPALKEMSNDGDKTVRRPTPYRRQATRQGRQVGKEMRVCCRRISPHRIQGHAGPPWDSRAGQVARSATAEGSQRINPSWVAAASKTATARAA
jgi:hypothetical protein